MLDKISTVFATIFLIIGTAMSVSLSVCTSFLFVSPVVSLSVSLCLCLCSVWCRFSVGILSLPLSLCVVSYLLVLFFSGTRDS